MCSLDGVGFCSDREFKGREEHRRTCSSHHPRNMPGIDPSVIVHKLNVDPDYRPVKQKRRSYAPERNQTATNEVDKLL
jgi:hypothetical protein